MHPVVLRDGFGGDAKATPERTCSSKPVFSGGSDEGFSWARIAWQIETGRSKGPAPFAVLKTIQTAFASGHVQNCNNDHLRQIFMSSKSSGCVRLFGVYVAESPQKSG